MGHIAITVVCTNAYFILGLRFIKKFNKFYKGLHTITYCVFTDTDPTMYLEGVNNVVYFNTVHNSWRDGTNSKFRNIMLMKDIDFDYAFYFDADTDIRSDFDDWFVGDSVGGEHFLSKEMIKKNTLNYEYNALSKAYIPASSKLKKMYFLGAFFGGARKPLFDMCAKLINWQSEDAINGIYPVCDDESYINRFFHFNPPSHLVPIEKFRFVISCKGGIEHTRDARKSVDLQKKQILEHPAKVFEIKEGSVVFS
jgi:hypothetical protein